MRPRVGGGTTKPALSNTVARPGRQEDHVGHVRAGARHEQVSAREALGLYCQTLGLGLPDLQEPRLAAADQPRDLSYDFVPIGVAWVSSVQSWQLWRGWQRRRSLSASQGGSTPPPGVENRPAPTLTAAKRPRQ